MLECSNMMLKRDIKLSREYIDTYAPVSTDIKKLRAVTGQGTHVCKDALIQTNGDMEEAIEWVRNYGNA